MTDPGNENKDEQTPDIPDEVNAQPSSESDVPPVTAAPSASDDDELPEYEELTPEIVEEEAIRGDFMLRWASIFLAVLFGFSQMADTRTLLHIRSGDQMRANGFLPSSQDSFSYTLEDQSTSNVSWLFDHVVCFVYALGGENALTTFKALVAGLIAYLLSFISIRNMPTWWSSVCVVLAMAACSVDFLPVTDLVTLFGMSLTLLMLHRHSENTASGLQWKLPVLIVIWANCDPRAYLGVFAILLFALGSSLRKSLAEKAGDPPGCDASVLWKAGVFSAVALLLNPSPLASLLSVVTTYSVEYPTMAAMKTLSDPSALLDGRTEYYSIFTSGVHQGIEFAYVAGFAMLVIAFVVLGIGRSREDLPWLLMCVGFAALALWKLHELPAAALVAAAAAGLAAQRWYARTFRQEYTIDTMEVLFSRGGRAVTVLAMAALGFLAVADRLPTRTAIGMGFDPVLRETIESVGSQLAELPDKERFFNTRVAQGDLLAWHGRQNFVDSRTALFGKLADDASVIARFDSLRKSLVARPTEAQQDTTDESAEAVESPPGYNENWLTEYDGFGITEVMLRLSPPGQPAYPMVRRFILNQEWVQTSRGASAVMFRHVSGPETQSKFDIRDLAFRTEVEQAEESAEIDLDTPVERFDFAREPGFYQKYLYNKRPTASAPLREAKHILQLDLLPAQVAFDIARATGGDPNNTELMGLLGRALAGPTLAIRGANKALLADPQNAEAHRTLGTAYLNLRSCEQAIANAMNSKDASSLRYLQAVMAFRQATIIEPEHADTWRMLTVLYSEQNRVDLALECVEKYLALEEETLLENPEAEAMLTQLYEGRNEWESQVEEVKKQLEEIASQPLTEDPRQQAARELGVVQSLSAGGHVLLALEHLKKAEGLLLRNPIANLLRGELLMESGEVETAYQILTQLAVAAREHQDTEEFAGVKWHTPVALTHLGKGEYVEAVAAFDSNLSIFDRFETKSPDLMKSLVQMLPLIPAVDAIGGGGALPPWPLVLLQQGQVPFNAVPASRNEPRFMIGLLQLENGDLQAAQDAFTAVITEGGETPYRPLAAVYLLQLTDDAVDTLKNSFTSMWEEFEFPEEAKESAGAKQQAKGNG